MTVEMCDVEIWVVVNEQGEYEAGTSSEEAAERFESNIGFDNETGTRRVKLTVKVPLPKVIEVTGEVTATEEVGELKAA